MTNPAYTAIVDKLRRTFRSGKTLPLEYRIKQLQQLSLLLKENEDELAEAINKDIHRPKSEAICFELIFAQNEITTALQNLDSWTKPQKVRRHLLQFLDGAFICKEPLGVVLIMGPWNYPANLIFCPLAGAIAAGNCAVLKPSEVSVHTAQAIARLIPMYLDQECFKVITAEPQECAQLLKERFDHIFYTGSPGVGKLVMEAASKHLTPVTLELGGKSPAIVDSDCDVRIAARRIAWGKFMSCGQTCLAPDYVLCHESKKSALIEELKKAVITYYGEDAQKSDDYCRIVGQKHFDRLLPLLQHNSVVYGGKNDRSDLYIEPTIVDNVKPTDLLMKDEIFGPILPILAIKTLNEAIEFINEREKPLAIYIFSNNNSHIDQVLKTTFSGGVTVNDVILHMGLDTLPFGGVGTSGMGRYHGKYTFDTFSHEKSVLHRGEWGESILWMRYPPYNNNKYYFARHMATKYRNLFATLCEYLPWILVSVLLGIFLQKYLL